MSRALAARCAITAVNLAEALSKMADHGLDPNRVLGEWTVRGLLGQVVLVYPVDEELALEIARLRPSTRSLGLSLGDRACLALARRLRTPVLTSDRLWSRIRVGVTVRVVG